MPHFRYQAREPQGRYVEGTIEADSPKEAEDKIAAQGLRPISVTQAASPVAQRLPQPPQAAKVPVAAPQAPVRQVHVAQPSQVIHVPSAVPVAPPAGTIHKTKWGTNKDLMLLFSQFASYLKAGINPAQAAHNLSTSSIRRDYGEALELASQYAAEGKGLSAAFASYPYLFPPHVVGLVKAGETGGFLPEACTAVSTQAEGARKFAFAFKLLSVGVIGLVLLVPIGVLLIRAALDTFRAQDAAGGALPGFGAFFSALLHQLMWPAGPIGAAGLLLLYGLLKWLLSMKMSLRRHTISSKMPVAGKRSWAEGMALFSWTLSNLFKAGAAPKTALLAAAATIPNLAVREEVERIGQGMNENTPLSQAFAQSRRLPPMYHSLALTGEMTGDLPGQLLMASNSSREELDYVEADAKKRAGCWGCLIYFVGMVILFLLFYGLFYGNLFKIIEEDTSRIPSTQSHSRSV